jgi:hypothetical protein
LQASREILQDYLLSPELYWPAPDTGEGMPRLSIGNILLSEARVRAAVLFGMSIGAGTQELELFDGVRARWRSTWAAKAGRELHNRISLWSNYLDDLAGDRGSNSQEYGYQVRLRVIITLLSQELLAPDKPSQEQMVMLDHRLQALTHSAAFVWDRELEAGFPRELFWFLYRSAGTGG